MLLALRAFVLVFFMLAPVCAQSIMEKTARDETVSIRSDDTEMRSAVAQAKSELQMFLSLAQAPRRDMKDFAVKVAIPSTSEFLWLADIQRSGDRLLGYVANTPRTVTNLKLGDRLAFKQDDIVDWKYNEGAVMKGNYTGCVLIRKESPEQQELFRKTYGLDCRRP